MTDLHRRAARRLMLQAREELRADYALDFDLAEGPDGSAPVVAGCKGLHELELRSGDGVDVHSAFWAEIPSPATELARAIVALREAIPAANVTWMIAGTPEDAHEALRRLETWLARGA